MADDTYAGASGSASGRAGSSHPLIESDRVEGTSVFAANGDAIGSVKRLMIEKRSGQVAYAVVSFGGFLGLGEDNTTVPWNTLNYDTGLGGYRTNITADQVKGAPAFSRDPTYNWSDRAQERDLHDYYGVSPYWGM